MASVNPKSIGCFITPSFFFSPSKPNWRQQLLFMNSETSSKCYTKWWEGALKLIRTEGVGTKNRLLQPLHTYHIRIINYHWSFHIATLRFLHESELLHGQLLYFPGSAPRTEALTLFLRRMMRQSAWAPQKTQKTSTSRADWPLDNLSISWTLCKFSFLCSSAVT